MKKKDLNLIKQIICQSYKCPVCHQKCHKEVSFDGVHSIPYCGFEFCRNRITRDFKPEESGDQIQNKTI